MSVAATIIQTERLDLIPMSPAFLAASLAGEQAAAEQLIGLAIPPDWWAETHYWTRIRLRELQADPDLQPWLTRAMGLRRERRMVGRIGFHSRPGADYLANLSPGGVEFGYTVFPDFRRRGYAREASQGLMAWAQREHGVTRFVVSISPTNLPSLNLAQQLGFKRIGAHIDDQDGPEDIFERIITGTAE
jgi:RimJ/RimL family protein N-acetyltransferase